MLIPITQTGAWQYNGSEYHESHHLDSPIADWIGEFLRKKQITTLFDFGCATGHYLKRLSETSPNLDLLGVEPACEDRMDLLFDKILQHDLAKPFDLGRKGSILCLEVLEHIPPQYESIAVENIVKHCDSYLFVSWARPGQGGHGHFNEKSWDDVRTMFESHGFQFLQTETLQARGLSAIDWIRNNFGVFRLG
jgi:hypothetical protein